MSTWKFEQFLNNSSLFFPNANKLTDQYEVSIPDYVMEMKRKELHKEGLRGRELEEEMASYFYITNPMKDLVLVNCWSVCPHESYALWKIYLSGEKNGIAIKSTVSKLRQVMNDSNDPNSEEYFIGRVKYKKHLNPDETNRLTIIATKKPFYDFENELRLFILNYPLSEGGHIPPYDITIGRAVEIDVSSLISEIYLSPFSDKEYRDEISDLLVQRGLSRKLIKESEIRDQ